MGMGCWMEKELDGIHGRRKDGSRMASWCRERAVMQQCSAGRSIAWDTELVRILSSPFSFPALTRPLL